MEISFTPRKPRNQRLHQASQPAVEIPHRPAQSYNSGTSISNWKAQSIYIDELARLIDREVGTIRRWESDGKLPRKLLPKRGIQRHRYWTYAQIYGKNGLLAWMRANDMRPGNLYTDPSKEHEHVAALRRPKFLTESQVVLSGTLADEGYNRIQIANKLLPEARRYKSVKAIDKALMSAFKARGWSKPPLYLKKAHLIRANKMRDEGNSLEEVIRYALRATAYTSPIAVERELRRVFDLYGWEMPIDDPADRQKRYAHTRKTSAKKRRLTAEQKAEAQFLRSGLRRLKKITK